MLALQAKKHRIPVIAISRNYCLSDKILLSQKSLRNTVNPLDYFNFASNNTAAYNSSTSSNENNFNFNLNISPDDFGVYITKDVDFIEGKYLSMFVTEKGNWMVDDIVSVQDQYWKY
jgi:translation initiation factor 2B subunit (eIF-2B alpha/beta/delta family)